MLSYFEFNLISKLFIKLEKTVYKIFLWTKRKYLSLLNPISKQEILEDLKEVIMINQSYIERITMNFLKSGFQTPTFLDPTQLQEYIFDYFNQFWEEEENRLGNEKLGYYNKKLFFDDGPRVLKIPRDRLNKFDCPKIKSYLKYSENLIYSLIGMLAIGKQSKSTIINYFLTKGIKVSRGLLDQINIAWSKSLNELMKHEKIPTNIHTIFMDATYTKTNVKYINQYDSIAQQYYYINNATGEVIYTDKQTWTMSKTICILRAYGRTLNSNKIYSLGYIIRDSESTENYTKLLKLIRNELDIKNPLIICTDGHKSIPCAIKEVYPDSKHQLCLVHLERELRNEVKSKYLRNKINELFKSIKISSCKEEAEDKVYSLFEFFDEVTKTYKKYLNATSKNETNLEEQLTEKDQSIIKNIGLSNIVSIVKNKERLWKKINGSFSKMFNFLTVSNGKEKISYTTNCIENGNKIFKSFIRNKGSFYGLDQIVKILNFLHFINNNT